MKISTRLLREMEDHITPTLKDCVSITQLKKVHARILISSLSQSNFLATQMINICSANGRTDYADLVFMQVTEPNIFLYNALIRAYTQNYYYTQAVGLYKKMLRRPQAQIHVSADKFTYPFVIKACTGLLIHDLGKQVHVHVCKCGLASNSVTQNSLIEMYTKCDNLSDANKVFDEMGERDVVSWNTLISGHARLGQMKKARAIFNSMSGKTVVSWTALVSGYTSIGYYIDALEVFHQMQLAGLEPDDISIVSVLPACAQLGALELGKWIHVYSDKHGLLQKTFICNALIEMYAKCGWIDRARQVFDEMIVRDVITWSTMIGGLATHGRVREAIQLFVEMENGGRVRPNCITFLGVLSACAHAGLLAEGLQYFDSMRKVYGLAPEVEHYGCIVDLLGCLGYIDRAVGFIVSMPILPDAAIWGSLLSACKTHGDIGIAITAMEQLLEFEPEDTGNYVLLSNIYAAVGRWDGVSKMRKLIRNISMKKIPGSSLIEVNNVVREFVAGDDSNPLFSEICEILDLLASQLGKIGIITKIDAEERFNSDDSFHEFMDYVHI